MYTSKSDRINAKNWSSSPAKSRASLKSQAREGIVVLYVQHTTAGLTVNENADPDVPRDMLHALRTLIPQHGMDFRHGEENSDAHIKASLVGPSVTIPFHGRSVVAGTLAGNLSLRVRRRPRAQSDQDKFRSMCVIVRTKSCLL